MIDGGQILQPVLYALALEKILPNATVAGGRLYYCTFAGEYKDVVFPLNAVARESAKVVADAVGGSLKDGFLPAIPDKGACRYCDYRGVCGPDEEVRTRKKKRERLVLLDALRRRT